MFFMEEGTFRRSTSRFLSQLSRARQVMSPVSRSYMARRQEPVRTAAQADADKLLGESVKSFAESPQRIIELLQKLELY